MKGKIIKICIALLTIGIIILVINYILDIKKRNEISNSIVKFINERINSPFLEEDSNKKLDYALSNDVNHYDISKAVNDYLDIVNKCMVSKINNDKFIDYNEDRYKFISDTNAKITIYAMKADALQYIKNNISEDDIAEYKKGTFNKKVEERLRKILKLDNDGKWVLSSDKDSIIELPYNVYFRYVSNKKSKSLVKKILNIKIVEPIHKTNNKEYEKVTCNVEYEDINGNIKIDTGTIDIFYDDKNNCKVDIYYLLRMFYNNSNRPTLTFGQHDYDEERDRHWSEIDDLMGDTPD